MAMHYYRDVDRALLPKWRPHSRTPCASSALLVESQTLTGAGGGDFLLTRYGISSGKLPLIPLGVGVDHDR